jgi:hypothetical protein
MLMFMFKKFKQERETSGKRERVDHVLGGASSHSSALV